jgi:alpha-tubulin suppressor-like RCC1 family protein
LGKVWGSGLNINGQLATGDVNNRSSFTQIAFFNDKSVAVITPRLGTTSFLETNGTLWNVGNNSFGLMGLGTTASLPLTTPVQLPNFIAAEVGGNGNTAYSLKKDGTLWAWGANSSGTLGTGTAITNVTAPIQIK